MKNTLADVCDKKKLFWLLFLQCEKCACHPLPYEKAEFLVTHTTVQTGFQLKLDIDSFLCGFSRTCRDKAEPCLVTCGSTTAAQGKPTTLTKAGCKNSVLSSENTPLQFSKVTLIIYYIQHSVSYKTLGEIDKIYQSLHQTRACSKQIHLGALLQITWAHDTSHTNQSRAAWRSIPVFCFGTHQCLLPAAK